MNRIDEISFVIRNASRKTLEKKADFLYYEALVEFRKENYKTADELVKKINRPSHSQVIKSIYKTASYSWKNYEKYLNPFKRQLEPWLRDYGYLDNLFY